MSYNNGQNILTFVQVSNDLDENPQVYGCLDAYSIEQGFQDDSTRHESKLGVYTSLADLDATVPGHMDTGQTYNLQT